MKYSLQPVKASCPICRCHQAVQLYAITSSESASHFVPQVQDPERYERLKAHIEKLWYREVCEVVQCCQCLFCYAWPFRSGDATFYDLAYDRTKYPAWKWEHQQTLDSIRQEILPTSKQPLRVLEIGAGNGTFIRGIVPDVTTQHHVVCTEYSSFGVDCISQLGVMCYKQDIREIAHREAWEPFHVLCMFQVLEHQDHLDGLFETITRISTHDSHLYISVPNQKFIEFIETNDALLDMPPNHTGRWNANCFAIIGKRHGWTLISHRRETSEPFLSRARKYAIYRYMRKSQSNITFAALALRLRHRQLKKWIQGILTAWYSIGKLPAFYHLYSDIYASSQWVHLSRYRA